MSWNVGDMCYWEFELSRITKMKGDSIVEITTGYIRASGNTLNNRCFPVTMPIKLISDEYDYWSKKIHKEGLRDLNFPDIHSWLVNHWVISCTNPDNTKFITDRYNELHEFCKEILDDSKEIKTKIDKIWYQFNKEIVL